jgi:predicted esterase
MAHAAHRHAFRFHAAVALGVVAVCALIVLRERSSARRHALASTADTAVVDWCGEGLEAIAGGGCFAASRSVARGPATLLVYLHGRYAPEGTSDELERQSRVARLATARGYAVLALRGMQGQCTDPQLASWWCWPSNERNAGDGPAFVARWSVALAEAERRARPAHRVLLGFSNGGYFASLIASRALAPFDAVAIAHAGPVEPMTPTGAAPPVLLVDADDDPSGPEVSRLDAALTRASWPHDLVVREGGHALGDWDVAMALTFFDRARREPVPLRPPLPARTARRSPDPEAATAAVGAAATPPDAVAAAASPPDGSAPASPQPDAPLPPAGSAPGTPPPDASPSPAAPAAGDPVLDPSP